MPPSTHCGTHPGCLPHVRAQGMCRPALSPTHTDCAPALSVRPPATHLTSPAPSHATATPPIAWTHATPCADRPHRHSLPSSRPVVCHAALPLLQEANLTPWRVRPHSLSIHLPAALGRRRWHGEGSSSGIWRVGGQRGRVDSEGRQTARAGSTLGWAPGGYVPWGEGTQMGSANLRWGGSKPVGGIGVA